LKIETDALEKVVLLEFCDAIDKDEKIMAERWLTLFENRRKKLSFCKNGRSSLYFICLVIRFLGGESDFFYFYYGICRRKSSYL
jgi:hypothetical protein